MSGFDLLIRNGWLVDPKCTLDGQYDIGLAGGKVAAVAPTLEGSARHTLDAGGRLVMPGIIDSHVHIPGRGIAHREMARAGVTTAVDFGGFRRTLEELPEAGAGLNIAGLQTIGPWPDETPAASEVEAATDEVLADGGLGIKIMGGHSPSSPDATALMIETANRLHAYVAYHVGSTATGSQLLGLREAFDLAGRNRLHIAHVNAYLRGMIRPPLEENQEALERLAAAYWMVSESHLGPRNGTGGRIGPDGMPSDWVTRNCLKMRGYELTREGLRQALADGYAAVNTILDGAVVQVAGPEGVRLWEQSDTRAGLSFPVNVRATALVCATAKVRRADGSRDFVVDAISTDGGSWRNFIAQNGLALVRFGALTAAEFVRKVSYVPALMFGMVTKGHLSPGADADVTILDQERCTAYASVVGGRVIMLCGTVIGSGATVICTGRGERRLHQRGFATSTVRIEDSLFWTKGDSDPGPGAIEIQ
ncbi:MAG: amidohydrolase family protein [Bacillota bacterium]|nr:amidohydrolase family protein [Bacillota bacterium]